MSSIEFLTSFQTIYSIKYGLSMEEQKATTFVVRGSNVPSRQMKMTVDESLTANSYLLSRLAWITCNTR